MADTTLLPARYMKLFELGRGGFGQVYLAEDHETQQRVAIKEAHLGGTLAHEQRVLSHIEQLREQEPVQGIPRLLDTIVVSQNEAEPEDQRVYLVMEHVSGVLMGDVTGQSYALSAVIDFITEFVGIMAWLHDHNVVHQDLHGYNMLLDSAGHIHVIDFGQSWVGAEMRVFQNEVTDMMYLVFGWLRRIPIPQEETSLFREQLLERVHALIYMKPQPENACIFQTLWQHILSTATQQSVQAQLTV